MNPIVLIESNNYHQTASFYSAFEEVAAVVQYVQCSDQKKEKEEN